MSKKIVEMKNVTVTIDGQTILEDISFDIFQKSILFIIGPNGAGKTTLIKVLLGIIKQSAGDIFINGQKNTPQVIAQNCGYVSQYFDVDRQFPISVEEVIDLNADGPEEGRKIREALQLVDAEKLLHRTISALSGGELQKVLIARALANKPKILILDEPTNNLDIQSQHELFRLLGELKANQEISILVISHDINVVSENADRVVCLNKRLGCTGKPFQVLTKEVLEGVYGRSLAFYGHT